MRFRSLVLALSLVLGSGIPAMAAGKYKQPKQPHVKRNMKPRKASKAAAKAARAKTPKRPKVKAPKHRKGFA